MPVDKIAVRSGTSLIRRLLNAAGIQVDSADNKMKFNDYSGTAGTVRSVVTEDQTQTLTGKSLTTPALTGKPTVYSTDTNIPGDGAIDITLGDLFNLSKGSAAAITLADPVAGDNGRVINIRSASAFAHVITVAGGLGGAGATDDVITFTNRIAANVTLKAVNTKWMLVGQYLAAVA